MDCRRLLEELNLYIDGSLEKEICEQLEAHLQDCQRCRIVLDTIKKTITLFRDQEQVEIPLAVQERLHQAIRTHWHKSK
ncbi:MAG TPA: zf-HC2 domain-containing protein [Terriglobia bacterium]|nr:zf-HC2 domain-containing protein [Terriglobia bacterium]